ncbi:MAG: hypothetical protein NT163_12765, partial [Chlorobiales bacterium]|nr:hypothetical protein [Chlorobiales bacterium]
MPKKNLSTLLTSLTGQIRTSNAQEEQNLGHVQEKIAQALLQQQPETINNQNFIFERSDLFSSTNLQQHQISKIENLVERVQSQPSSDTMQVFMRTLPIRTTQAPGSTPAAAAGARVNTYGPFKDSAGRELYFDFVRIEKLIPLYINGWTEPAILFKASFVEPRFVLANSLPVEITKKYSIVPDSVWINARIFQPAADSGFFCGLRVKGGSLTLDNDPQIINGQLTITATTTVLCDLQLEQNTSFASDPSSPFGVDARKADYKLPETFRFNFKGNTKTILDIHQSAWSVYVNKAQFNYK